MGSVTQSLTKVTSLLATGSLQPTGSPLPAPCYRSPLPTGSPLPLPAPCNLKAPRYLLAPCYSPLPLPTPCNLKVPRYQLPATYRLPGSLLPAPCYRVYIRSKWYPRMVRCLASEGYPQTSCCHSNSGWWQNISAHLAYQSMCHAYTTRDS
jgi:hypothetical protein